MGRESATLRKLLKQQSVLVVPGVYDVMSGLIAEAAGFKAIYMTGAGTSMFTLGQPDIGLITMDEMIGNAARIVARVNVPLISDADTGFGNAIGVIRTVREFIQRGIAGIHIEDQISPKRCGHTAGKICISAEEFVGKIKAAADTRDEYDPDFVVIARCDFRGAVGGSLDGAIERCKQYVAAGADVIFCEGLLSVDELKRVIAEVPAPILYNMVGISPVLTIDELNKIGVKLVIIPGASTRAAFVALKEFMKNLSEDITYQARFEKEKGLGAQDVFAFVGFGKAQEMEEKYLPKEMLEARYSQASVGNFGKTVTTVEKK